jgi:starvation-inducible DNA-binding protein
MSKKLIQSLNKTLANLHIINVKLHNYHWNIQGIQFFSIHNMTEGYYDYFFGLYDDVAERILQLKAKPLATVKEYLENATLKEETGSKFTAREVLDKVRSDFEFLLKEAKGVSDLAGELGDTTTANIMDDYVQWLEKAIWMIDSSLDA